jgi:hypothetical protein
MKIRTPQPHSIIRGIVILLLAFAPMAQAQDLPQDLTSISMDQALALNLGRLFRVADWPDYPPLPVGVLPSALGVQVDAEGNATNLFYSASLSAIFLDDREWAALQALEAAQGRNHQMSEDEEEGNDLPPLDTTQLYLEITNVASGLAYFNLHNATNQVYAIWATCDLAAGWSVATEVWPTNADVMPFTLPTTLGADNLFVLAQDWTGVTENGNTTPDWWFWQFFGTVALSDTNLDSQGTNTLFYDYTNHLDPNVIAFTVSTTNSYVTQTTVPLQISLLAGTPNYYSVLVNDTNPADADWLPYAGTNLTVSLGSTDGVYTVTVGLRGLPPTATQTWQALTIFCDSTPLRLALTNLPAFSGWRPFIDPAGYASRALSSLAWTLVDANGATNTGNGTVVAQDSSFADPYHRTNWVQCVDLALALGTNWVSIRAVDWAGTVATTNFAYVFDTNADTTAPTLTLIWPQEGSQVTGDNFTIQASTDDDTAAVALQYTDGDGMVQAVKGLVERGGNVWVPSVPLLAGTNSFTLLATDAAGNVSTNAFTVLQSGVDLAIIPLSEDELKYAYAWVWAEVDASAAALTINGVAAEDMGSGYWLATNVPIQLGGTVTLQATAQLDGSTSVQALLKQERGPIVFTQTYGYKLDFTLVADTNTFEACHFDLQWARRAGGTNTQTVGWWFSDGTTSSNVTVTVWPPDNGYWPMLRGQLTYSAYTNGVLLSTTNGTVDAPRVEWMEESGSAGSWPDHFQASWTESSRRDVELFTGGDSLRQRQSLFDLRSPLAWEAEVDRGVYNWDVRFWGQAFQPFLQEASPSVAVPSEQISLDALGKLDSDGHLWAVESDGQELVITPEAPATSYKGELPSATKHKPQILFNGADVTGETTNVWVGQHINPSFQFDSDPPEPVTNYFWTVSGQPVGYFRITFNSGTNVPLTRLNNSDVSYYWVDAAPSAPVKCTVKIRGLELTAQTTFNVLKPDADWNGVTNGTVAVVAGYLADGTPPFATAGMQFIFTNLHLRGYSGTYEMSCAQIASLDASFSGLDLVGQPLATNLTFQGIDSSELWQYEIFGQSQNGVTQDSPKLAIYTNAFDPWVRFSRITAATYSGSFAHYLYFQPDPSGDSIPVALKQITWTISLHSTNSPNSSSADTVDTSATSRAVPSSNVPVAGNPEWTSRTSPPGGLP